MPEIIKQCCHVFALIAGVGPVKFLVAGLAIKSSQKKTKDKAVLRTRFIRHGSIT